MTPGLRPLNWAEMVKLAPSILAADFRRLGEQIRAAESGGADLIHVDVMDGHFVPSLSVGLPVVEACRAATRLPLDVHLMIEAPERFLREFAQAGASVLTVHAEATPHAHRAVAMIRDLGLKAGLALNPGTPLDFFRPLLSELDLALVMSVDPGYGGQRFLTGALERLELLREWRDHLNPGCQIEVDGGIDRGTAGACVAAGAGILVAGSAIFNAHAAPAENLAALRSAVSGHSTERTDT